MDENYIYPAIIQMIDEHYGLRFIDFPAIMVEGDTLTEAVKNAQKVLALAIIDYESKKEKLPTPTEHETNVIYVHVWMPYYRSRTKTIYVRKNVTIPEWIDDLAKGKGINISAALVHGLEDELGLKH